MLFVSLLRGLFFYLALIAGGTGLGWLILPWRYGTGPDAPHMLMAMVGGGALLLLIVVAFVALAASQS